MSRSSVWLRSLFQETVWSSYSLPKVPRRFRAIYTVVLPLQFLILGSYGAASIGAEIKSIDAIFGNIYGDIWSVALGVAGYVALLGLALVGRKGFNKVELAGLAFLITLMLLYVGAIFAAALLGLDQVRFLSMLIVIIFLPLTAWRTIDLVLELRPARHV